MYLVKKRRFKITYTAYVGHNVIKYSLKNQIMKLTFTKKLILDSVEKNNGITIVQLASYLKEDFIEHSIRITIENNIVKKIYFSSNENGTATWVINKGIIESHRWESEDDINELSFLSRHFPIALEDGKVTNEFALKKIIPDILDNLIDLDLSSKIYKIITSHKAVAEYNWDDLINSYKTASNDFIDKLILKYQSDITKYAEVKENNKLSEKYFKSIESEEIDNQKSNNLKIDELNERTNARKYLENAQRISKKLSKLKIS